MCIRDRALRAGDPVALADVVRNDLQRAACSLLPALDEVLRDGDAAGALAAFVSGSGPTVAFLAADAEAADQVVRGLRAAGRGAVAAYGPVPGARVLG